MTIGSTRVLYGRDAERAALDGLLEGARQSRSGALVLRGEAGTGKSALLEYAREQAAGMHVVRASGIESETPLPYAALHRLVRPLLGYLDQVPRRQAAALRSALGEEEGGSDDRFLVSLATLSLLSEVSERHPLLCLVDDAHLLDDASTDALVFAARRLEAEGVVILFAARDGAAHSLEVPDLPMLRLAGLDHAAAAALLDDHSQVALSPNMRDRIIEATGGNPLALLELPSVLSEEQLAGADPLTPLPVGAQVERAFLERVRRLPLETQTLLLVAAADDTSQLATVLRAAAQLGIATSALDAAEQANLLHVTGGAVAFHHPLVRSAIYHGAVLSQRQAAHGAIASVLDAEADADRRAWHRANAAIAPDPEVVAELDRAAERARLRSAFAAASLAFERGATLSADEQQRSRRLTAAAENAWLAGRIERAQTLLDRARPLASSPTQQADIDRYLGLIEMTRGSPANAGPLLLRAARQVAPVDSHRALDLLNIASIASVYAGDRKTAAAIAEDAQQLSAADTALKRMLVELLVGLGAFFEGDFNTATPHLRAALVIERDETHLAVEEQPTALLFAGRAALFLGDDEAVLRTHHQAAEQARTNGALGFLTQILPRLGNAELAAGRWGSATANARESLDLARELGQTDLVAYSLVLHALLAAHRGDENECRSLTAEAHELATTHRFTLVAEFAHWALTLLELGLGNHDAAILRARDITSTGAVYWSGLDRIEAAIRSSDRDTARRWLDELQAWANSIDSAWARAVGLHCQALLAPDDGDAERSFRSALDTHAQAGRPFERARTTLAFGEFLRRTRRRVESREHLRAALDTFEVLGARSWAERAGMELRASGETARRRDPTTTEQLTPQELQIAQFVARGMTNRDVAAHLFLSPRTVAFHLRNIFRKLGITSRSELAHLSLEPDQTTER